jgi:hypothetical protein
MNLPVHGRNSVLLAGVAALLAACNDQPDETETPFRDCADRLHDSGHVLYVVLNPQFPETAGSAFTFLEYAGDVVPMPQSAGTLH